MIKLYIYRKSDGAYLYEDFGSEDGVLNDIDDSKDFTLTPPPEDENQWQWHAGKWVIYSS